MGIYFVFFKKVGIRTEELSEMPAFTRSDYAKTILSGFLINSLNPSVLLFWLINATAFATTHDIPERTIIFGVCLLVNMISDIIKVMMAGSLRQSLTPENIRHINRISGSILVLFGIALFYGVIFLKNKPS
jgi:threonine/homoserine/homoserine lactone efflux protein